MEFHKLFEHQYNELVMSIDATAERISKLDAKTIGTTVEFSKLTTIKEHPNKYASSKEMVKELLLDHETVILELRRSIDSCSEKYKDVGTADYLTGLIEQHETIAWALRRYLR